MCCPAGEHVNRGRGGGGGALTSYKQLSQPPSLAPSLLSSLSSSLPPFTHGVKEEGREEEEE